MLAAAATTPSGAPPHREGVPAGRSAGREERARAPRRHGSRATRVLRGATTARGGATTARRAAATSPGSAATAPRGADTARRHA
jgi:hypothetical protein